MTPILTETESAEGEFESHYVKNKTTFQVDHKGRVFVTDETVDEMVILNEAVDAGEVLPKIIVLAARGFRPIANDEQWRALLVELSEIGEQYK